MEASLNLLFLGSCSAGSFSLCRPKRRLMFFSCRAWLLIINCNWVYMLNGPASFSCGGWVSRYLDHRLGTFARWPLLWSLWSAKGRLSSPNAIVPLPRLDHVGSIRGPGNQSVGVELLLSEEFGSRRLPPLFFVYSSFELLDLVRWRG